MASKPASAALRPAMALALAVLTVATGCSVRKEDAVRTPAPADTARMTMTLSSPAFADGERIPERHAGQGHPGGGNASPPLQWGGEPEGTRSFALVMVDRHPVAREFVHWAVVGIPPTAHALPEGASGSAMPQSARELRNTRGSAGYSGPTPPAGTGAHEYEISVYALDVPSLGLRDRPDSEDLSSEMEGHVLAYGTLSGTVER